MSEENNKQPADKAASKVKRREDEGGGTDGKIELPLVKRRQSSVKEKTMRQLISKERGIITRVDEQIINSSH